MDEDLGAPSSSRRRTRRGEEPEDAEYGFREGNGSPSHTKRTRGRCPERESSSYVPSTSSEGGGLREMSIEEMNAMRKKLNLKPLSVSSTPSSKPVVSDENLSTEERLKLAKEKRLERERARGRRNEAKKTFSLGDASDEDESASSWVEKHKHVVEEKKRAEALAKQLEEEEEEQISSAATQIDVDGLRVAHDIDQLGQDSILVLKDAHILDEEGDELENLDLVSVEKGKRYQDKIKKKSKYDIYDEDGNSKGVLSHYDEEENEKNEKSKKGFYLGKAGTYKPVTSGESASTSKPQTSTINMSVAMDQSEGEMYSDSFTFGSRRGAISSDFENADSEEVTFGKKGVGENAQKAKKKIKKRKTEIESSDDGTSILDSLSAVPTNEGKLLSRYDRERLVADEESRAALERKKNFSKYQSALLAAAAKSQAVFGESNSSENIGMTAAKSRQEEIAQRTREMAAARREQELRELSEAQDSVDNVYSSITDFAFIGETKVEDEKVRVPRSAPVESISIQRHSNSVHNDDHSGEAAMDIDEGEREEAPQLVKRSAPNTTNSASSTSTKEVKVKLEREEHAGDAEEGEKRENEESDESRVREEASRIKKMRGKKQTGLYQEEIEESPMRLETVKKEEIEENSAESKLFVPSDDGSNNSHKVNQGLGATLSLLLQRGAIESKESKKTEVAASASSANTGGRHSGGRGGAVPEYYREIEIERKDEWGRTMSQKEAWKTFSSQFSGRTSGKRKQEKKYEKFKEQIKQQKESTGSAIESSLQSIQKVQKKSAAPFVVLTAQSVLGNPGSSAQNIELGDTLKNKP